MDSQSTEERPVEIAALEAAESVAGFAFTPEERALMVGRVTEARAGFAEMRQHALDNATGPA